MALSKRTYVGGTTKITAANLNDIQDSIIALEGKGLTKEEVVDALEYTPAKASDIPTTDISANTAARHSHSNKDVLDNIAEITGISGGAVTGGANALVTKEVLDATSQLITDEIPSELKNPYALTFEGAASGTYDGSSAVTINIPTGGGSSVTVDSALSATSTNPVQNKVIKSALDGKLSTSGGTLTGNLTGKYITGTWLQSTAAGHQEASATKVAVLDAQGWIYYRTPAELMSDMGFADGAEVFYIDLAGDYPDYNCPVAMTDIKAAYEAGKVLECRCAMGKYTVTLPLFIPMPIANTWIFSGAGALTAMGFPAQSLTIAIVNGTVQASDTRLASTDDIPVMPTVLPNPHALTIKIGSTTVTYDGSSFQTVEIANGSGSGGSNLPAVTTSDNGKFLQVVNGVWSAVSIPSGEGVNF